MWGRGRHFLCATLVPAAAASAQTLSLNLPAALAPAKARLGAGQVASMVVIGDSLAYREGTWLPEFRARLQARYGNAGAGHLSYAVWSGAGFGSGWTWGMINQDTAPHRSLDGMWATAPSSGGWSIYHAGASPHLTLMVAAEPGAGSVTVTPAGGAPVVLDGASPSNMVRTVEVSNAAGLGDVVCTTSGGAVTLLGVSLTTGAPGALVHRVANGGWGVNNYLQRDWTFDAELSLLAPDLVYVWIGQNDQAYSGAAYAPLIDQLVDRVAAAAPGAGIVLVGTYDAGGSAIPSLVNAVQSVASTRGLGFINLYAAGGEYPFLFLRGYLDGFHFSSAGGAYFARIMDDAFETGGTDLCDVEFGIQPVPVETGAGQVAVFTAYACAGGSATYRWRRNGLELSDDARVSGSFTSMLQIDSVGPDDQGFYDVVVTGPCGSATSAPATLTVIGCPSDFTRDGFVTGDDFDAFMDAFVLGLDEADYDQNTFVTGDDFDAFMDDFIAGC